MIRFFTFFLAIYSLATFAQNIPNGSFEDWKTYSLGFQPDEYPFTSFEEQLITDSLTIIRSEDAQSGNYAMYLKTIGYFNEDFMEQDTSAGFAVLGQPDEGAGGGFAISEKPDSLVIHAKFNIPAGDTADIVVWFFMDSNIVTLNFFPLTGTQSTYKRFAFALDTTGNRNSALIGFTSSHIAAGDFSGIPGSEIWIDNISFTGATTEIPNSGFENWTELTYSNPDNWDTYNYEEAFLGFNSVTQVTGTEAYEGSSAIKAIVTEFVNEYEGNEVDTSRGLFISGEFVDYEWMNPEENTGFAYDLQPESFNAFYKYKPNGDDTAYINILFLDGKTVIGNEIIILSNEQDDYTEINKNISIISDNSHDSVIILIHPGKNPGTEFTLDAVKFVLPSCMDSTVFSYDDAVACDEFTINAATKKFDAWLWDDFTTDSTLTVMTSGTYFVDATISDSNCTVRDSVVIIINKAAQPTIVQDGNELTSSMASSYQWYKNGNTISGETMQTLNITENGVYQVEITDNNGCMAISDSTSVTFTAIDIINSTEILIFPNPSMGFVNISTSNLKNDFMVTIYDVLGREVYQSFNQKQLNIHNLNNGIYMMIMETQGERFTQKITLSK